MALHIRKIKPMFTSIITTGERFEKDDYTNGIITAKKGDLKVWQTVIAIGSSVRDINVGDKVMIDVSHYMVKRYSKDSLQNDLDNNPTLRYQFNWVTIEEEEGNPQECLLLSDRDILFTFEGEEKDEIICTQKNKFIIS